MIYLGADHRGFNIKNEIKDFLKSKNVEFFDCGAHIFDNNDDYPDYAFAVAQKVQLNSQNLGILICYSGEGMCIAANKVKGIRAALCNSEVSAKLSREHNNANILILNSELEKSEYSKILMTFLETQFSNEPRHKRRIDKITEWEDNNFK